MTLVSIIIPNFNHVSFLKERINSVLNQTFQNFELIILDDCSTDNSREVIEFFRNHSKISHIIYNKENSGSVFQQWKKGVELAKGEFIWIAESDDYAHPAFLEKMMPVLESNHQLGFVYCDANFVNDKNKSISETFAERRNKLLNTAKWNSSYRKEGIDEIKECLIEYCTVNNASGVLFRKEALKSVNPFDQDFKYIGDWYCYLKICKNYQMAYLNEPLNYYRHHSINASNNLYKNETFIVEYFKLFDWIYRNIKVVDDERIEASFNKYIRLSIFRNWNIQRVDLFVKLLNMNPRLFWTFLIYNFKAPFSERFSKV